jgi:hypothetical protein
MNTAGLDDLHYHYSCKFVTAHWFLDWGFVIADQAQPSFFCSLCQQPRHHFPLLLPLLSMFNADKQTHPAYTPGNIAHHHVGISKQVLLLCLLNIAALLYIVCRQPNGMLLPFK